MLERDILRIFFWRATGKILKLLKYTPKIFFSLLGINVIEGMDRKLLSFCIKPGKTIYQFRRTLLPNTFYWSNQFYFFYLRGRERSLVSWFTPQIPPTTAGQDSRTHPGLPHGCHEVELGTEAELEPGTLVWEAEISSSISTNVLNTCLWSSHSEQSILLPTAKKYFPWYRTRPLWS